jgi:hypothetical protein
MDSIASPKVKTIEGEGVGARSLVRNTLGVERCWSSGMGLGQATSGSNFHMNLHKPNKLVNAQSEHFWCIDEPWVKIDSQDSPHPGLGEATTFPLIVFYVWPRG